MLAVRRFCLGSALLVLSAVGCDNQEPVGPNTQPLFRATEAPSGTNAVVVSYNRIDVYWQDNSPNETGFEVHRSTTGATGTFDLRASTGASATSYGDWGLNGSTEYCYKLRALRTTGRKTTYSEFSNTVCATTPEAPPPPGPAAPSGTDARPAHSTAVNVTWIDNSTDESGFRLEFSLDLGSTWTFVGIGSGSNMTSFHHWGLTSDQTVCYRVIAHNAQGRSLPSNVDCTAPPKAPGELTAVGVAGPVIDVTWTDSSAVEDGYEVRRAAEGVALTVVADLPANSNSYRDLAVQSDTRYSYVVRAKKDGGFSYSSNGASVVVATTVPIAPSGMDATPWSSTEVGVGWVDNSSNEDGFRIERSSDGGGSWAVVSVSLYGISDGGRTSEQQVCYRVVAFNGLGDSPPSNVDCTTPAAGPTNLTATLIDEQTIELSWTDNSGVEDGYELWVYTYDASCDPYYCEPYSYSIALPANATTHRISASEYFYGLAALKDGGYSDWLFTYSAGALPSAAPARSTARPHTRP